MNRPISFQARIVKQGILRCVDVPAWVSQAFGTGRVAVRGRVHGVDFQSTLAPRGEGLHRLFIHSRVYRRLGVDCGDLVEIELARDANPEPTLPEDLARALEADREAREAFDGLSAARRREIVGYLEAAKRPDTRARRVQEMAERLKTDLRPRRPPLLD